LSAFAGALASAFGAPFAYARRGNQKWTEVCSLMSRKTLQPAFSRGFGAKAGNSARGFSGAAHNFLDAQCQ